MIPLRKEYYGKVAAVVIQDRSYTIDKDFFGRYSNAKELIADNTILMSKYFEIEQPVIEEVQEEPVEKNPIKKTKKRAAK